MGSDTDGSVPLAQARRDVLIGGILIAATLLLVSSEWRLLLHCLEGPSAISRPFVIGVILNIATLLFGWTRYRELVRGVGTREAAGARATALLRRDELTGFLNRRTFAEAAAAAVRANARRDRAVALLVIDLDHFKTVNEAHGHLIGDAVLRAAAETIRRALPPSAVVGRLDGDRFALAIPHDARHPGTVDGMAEHLVGALAQPIETRGATAHIGASIGIARTDGQCRTVEALLRRATIAMRRAKADGRGRQTWFDASMERELERRTEIEAGLREGIPAGRFVPFYEPQVEIGSGRLIGFEVLARWEQPSGEIVGPDTFIPVAEECGLIGDLSAAVMRRAFLEARDWDASLTLSVNISPAQLRDPWLAQKIVKLLVETGFPASRLEIEITETSLYDNLPLAQTIVGSLKNQGIRLALDDFGTGYSSLAHLRALPFDRIKIDRSFVTAMVDDAGSAAIVNAIQRLGDSLELTITAEGIEDARIAQRLVALGCAKGQGWHYGKPMAVGATRRLLAERGLLPSARASLAPEAELRRAG